LVVGSAPVAVSGTLFGVLSRFDGGLTADDSPCAGDDLAGVPFVADDTGAPINLTPESPTAQGSQQSTEAVDTP
jgi:hypothetical protein